jgi:uncharacterized Fe-S cluster-containing radical SAM superfamily protein
VNPPFSKKLNHLKRTRVCDSRYNNSSVRIGEISTKAYAQKIFQNITDVSPDFFSKPLRLDNVMKDRTHPPEYYNPEHDIIVDHGTVSKLHRALTLILTTFRCYIRLTLRSLIRTAWQLL